METGLPSEGHDIQPIAISLEELLGIMDESDLMLERNAHLWRKEDMEKYKEEAYQILVGGNAKIGGALVVDSADRLVAGTDYWKLCQRKGWITTVICHSDKRGGRQTCHGGCLMTEEGKRDMSRLMKDEMERLGPKVWAVVSGRGQIAGLYMGMDERL